jgi:Protein of unknown function (DUF1236)
MERRLLPSTIALGLVLGTVAASAQTRQPSDRNQNPPQMMQAPQPGQQPAAGQAQTQQPQHPRQQDPARQGQAQPGNTSGAANTGAAGADAPQDANANANAQTNQRGVITLNEQQNTRVSVAIRQANVRPMTNVSFSIAVGTEIPPSVQLHVLPPALVEVLPQFRGYSFLVVEQEALIVDPGTRAIVAVIPFEATTTGANEAAPAPAPAPAQAAAPPAHERKKLELTRDQREILRQQAQRHRKSEKSEKHVIIEERRTTGAGHREPRVGDRVPDSVVIEIFPEEVYREVPAVRGYRYYPTERGLRLIDPHDRGVIEDIE